MPTYFHIAPLSLSVGSVIEPGNWGRVLNCYTINPQAADDAWLLAREMAFEAVRGATFPHLPSRLSCAFVFEERTHAEQHAAQFSPWHFLYEVELVAPTALQHRAGFNFLSWPPTGTRFISEIMQRAIPYWSGQGIQVPEVITMSGLRILARITNSNWAYQPEPRVVPPSN